MEINLDRVKEIKIEKGGRHIPIKGLMVLLICILTVYAPIELTRVIIAWGLTDRFIFEVIFVWLFYSLAILMISAMIRVPGTGKGNRQEKGND